MENCFDSMKNSLTNLHLHFLMRPDWDFNSMYKLTKLSKLTIDLPFHHFHLTGNQMSGLRKIQNLKSLSIMAYTTGLVHDLIKLINIDRLQELHIKSSCQSNLKAVYDTVIDKVGVEVEKLTLWSELSLVPKTWCECQRKDTLDEEQVSKVLKKCPNLKELTINGKYLSLEFLADVEHSYDLTLIMEPRKSNSLKRYKNIHCKVLEVQSSNQNEKFILPDKILIKVFQHLALQDILLNAAQVNKQFTKFQRNQFYLELLPSTKLMKLPSSMWKSFFKTPQNFMS